MADVLIIDDEVLLGETVASALREKGHRCERAETARAGLERAAGMQPDVILLDLKLPDAEGLELLGELHSVSPGTEVIVITAFGSIERAVEAVRAGALDFMQKPLDLDAVELAVQRACETGSLRRRVAASRRRDEWESRLRDLVDGGSPAMRPVFEAIERFSGLDLPRAADVPTVLISGETGTGKNLVARAIHARSRLRDAPFVLVNCTNLSKELFESELFGYERGAFTGAVASKEGLFEAAEGGTIFFDEIGEVPLETQARLLSVVERRRGRRLGGTRERFYDVRILAATNRDLEREVERGRFRRDLYYRLAMVRVHIPPLRERPEDLEALARFFLERVGRKYNRRCELAPETIEAMRRYPWPGNVRELAHSIERAVLAREDGAVIRPDDFGFERPGAIPVVRVEGGTVEADFSRGGIRLEEVEAELIRKALRQAGGNVSRAARLLGLSRSALRYRIEKFDLAGKLDEEGLGDG